METDFAKIDENKNPKMLIVCEDTTVVPFVEEYLENNGLGTEDVLTIDSNKKGDAFIKASLFIWYIYLLQLHFRVGLSLYF